MKKALNLVLLSVLLGTSCTKETEPDPCAMGTIKFDSYSIHSYSLYVNDRLVKNHAGRSAYDHSAFTGQYTVKVVQDSGYIATPYVKEYSLDLQGCETETIVIPKQPGEPDK
ncbi:MAG TPA: hypothetical protein VIN07_10240 [Flavipsychrobacter sp.]